jgi:hypothetical protein
MTRMLMKSFLTFGAVLISVSLFSQNQPAQPAAQKPAAQQADTKVDPQADPAEKYSEADRPEENYLEKFHALDICEKLQVENLELIRILNVITTNFKSTHSDWESDFKGIYDGYKSATDLYYKRNVIYARVGYEKNHDAILKFYKKISDAYKKDCDDLMNKCADVLLERTLGSTFTSGSDGNVRRATADEKKSIFKNKMRIRIAYGQMDDAVRSVEDGTPQSAVFHYRIAKGYAISILEELDEQNSKNKYDLHKADNRNRILVAKKESTQPAATQPK